MSTRRFIRYFSKHIYRYLSRVFSFKLAIDERGINDHLIFKIAEYCNGQGFADVLIYKSRAPHPESIYGHDFDLFVECRKGEYSYFALQAKVMNYNGKYASFDVAKEQWKKMKEHENSFKSKAYYMFYNGKYLTSSIPMPTRTDCLGTPKIEEYGIGIVENGEVEKIAAKKSSIKFTDFFPQQMDTFRKLFYCPCSEINGVYLHQIYNIDIKPPYFLVTSNSDNFEGEVYKDPEFK